MVGKPKASRPLVVGQSPSLLEFELALRATLQGRIPLPPRISGRIASSDMHVLWRTGPAAGNALDRSRT